MLCSVLLIQAAVNKLVVLGIKPLVVNSREMREYPQRIGCYTTVGVQCQLVQFLFKIVIMLALGRGAQILDSVLREAVREL